MRYNMGQYGETLKWEALLLLLVFFPLRGCDLVFFGREALSQPDIFRTGPGEQQTVEGEALGKPKPDAKCMLLLGQNNITLDSRL